MTFSQMLAKLMKESNVTAYKLAKNIKVHQTTIKNWLTGETKPNEEKINNLANYFDVSVDYLLGKTDIKKPQELSDETVQRVRELIKDIENPSDDGDSIGVVMDFGGDTQQFYKLSKEKADVVRKLMEQLKDDTDKK